MYKHRARTPQMSGLKWQIDKIIYQLMKKYLRKVPHHNYQTTIETSRNIQIMTKNILDFEPQQ